jgi:hypothetical protein
LTWRTAKIITVKQAALARKALPELIQAATAPASAGPGHIKSHRAQSHGAVQLVGRHKLVDIRLLRWLVQSEPGSNQKRQRQQC